MPEPDRLFRAGAAIVVAALVVFPPGATGQAGAIPEERPAAAEISRLALAADSAWSAGRHADAVAGYGRLLVLDGHHPQANFRTALWYSWEGRIDSALVCVRRGRVRYPRDLDLMVTEARLLSWQESSRRRALALLDSALALDPACPEARLALARIRRQQGRPLEARREVLSVLRRNPADGDARDLERALRHAGRPHVEIGTLLARDSDGNRAWLRTSRAEYSLNDRLRLFAVARSVARSDPVREAASLGGEFGLAGSRGGLTFSAAFGPNRVDPAGVAKRSPAAYRWQVGFRPGPRFGLGLGLARRPLDDTARLAEKGYDVSEFEGTGEWRISPRHRGAAAAGAGWSSDGNLHRWGSLEVAQTVGEGLEVGARGLLRGYARPGAGYFSPRRFLLAEARGAVTRTGGAWRFRAGAAVGLQQVDRGGSTQAAWGIEPSIEYSWSESGRVALSCGVTTSAAGSSTGAYSSGHGGVTLRLGL